MKRLTLPLLIVGARSRSLAILALALLVALTGLVIANDSVAVATPSSGVTPLAIAKGRFDDISVKAKTDVDPATRTMFWQAMIDTKGTSDLEIIQNTIVPGGTFGWHSHPGPSLVIVKSGTATFYLADDPTCSPHVVTAGSGFVDAGGATHIVRNEGNVDLVTVVASLIPAGAMRRIDQPNPGNCGF